MADRMDRDSCVFESKQWGWTRSYIEEDFCGMLNTIVVTHRNRQESVRVNIPAEFIRYVRMLHGLETLHGVSIHIEEYGAKYRMLYTLRRGDKIDIFYLWPLDTLPVSINPAIHSYQTAT